MTVPELDLHSTDSLVSTSKFYPAEIRVPHHQLRNFISTAYEDKIFFVYNFDIFAIDIQKQQQSLVATVPFEARCLAANHGWVCVGGEAKGHCAFVKIGDDNYELGQYGQDLLVETLGKEIVNSMTIHRVPGRDVVQKDEIVVLISNNDRTVTLYSLSQRQALHVLPHACPMNFASMSPDCTIIAAVGDTNEVCFYRRQDAEDEDERQRLPSVYQKYNWKQFAVPQIPAGDGVYDDFSFAVAFSPSGQYCAVSAQGGAITVFDMQQVSVARNKSEAENAILCTFRSSRSSLWGCVRSLSFSPEPWDLLAWTEDHGTIGIADIRRSFVRRQCVSLNREAAELVEVENITSPEYDNMNVKDRLKHQFIQRARASRGQPPVGARALVEARASLASQGSSSQDSLDLDARERSVLEALETTIDDVEHYSLRPYSVNYTSSPGLRLSVSLSEQQREYEIQLLNPGARIQESQAPRRRQSVAQPESAMGPQLLPPEGNRVLMTASPAPMSEDNPTPPMSTNDLTPSNNTSSQPLPYNIPPSDSWSIIEAQLATGRAGSSSEISAAQTPSLAQIENAISAERQISMRLERQLADERRLSALLRTELEARERLLEARQQDLESQRARDSRLSPALERVLQRQLQSEQENGRMRSSEIQNEIVSNSQRIEHLMAEREALLLRAIEIQDIAASPIAPFSIARPNARSTEDGQLDRLLRQMEEERRVRRQRIQDLELQVRRAESRVEIASAQSGLDSSRDRSERVADARFLQAARTGHSTASLRRAQQMDQYGVPFGSRATPANTSTYTNRLRTAAARRAEAGVSDARSTVPRTSELAGRVSENDMRLARSMLHAAVMDANGNWVTGHAVRRNPGQSLSFNGIGTGRLPPRPAASDEALRDKGIGTAGVGWNLDGSYLYIGTEEGIFEYKVNLRDRMQFPSLKMR